MSITSSHPQHHSVQFGLRVTPKTFALAGKIAQNTIYDVAESPHTIKNFLLIYSVFAMVSARSALAYLAAKKTDGTPQDAMQNLSAIQTTIMQFGGWFNSYCTLAIVKSLTQKGFNKAFGIVPEKTQPFGMGRAWQDSKKLLNYVFNGVGSEAELAAQIHTPTPIEALEHISTLKPQQYDWLKKLTPKHADKIARLAVAWGPISLGSLAAILISGFWLTWFNQKYCTTIAKLIDQQFHPKSTMPSASQSVSPTVPAQMSVTAQPSPYLQALQNSPFKRFAQPALELNRAYSTGFASQPPVMAYPVYPGQQPFFTPGKPVLQPV